ncbi:hypothetical protein [Aquipuribacter hungaricus]|uniref:Uncharacterized protein n=1 Tax=Aquipuribacter hungaricus TaxID=545624 RepID=A0ABV7WC77_9MICO
MTTTRTRTARLFAGLTTGALLAVGVAVSGAAPASALPVTCAPGTDLRTASDLLPKPGVVIPDTTFSPTEYFTVSVDDNQDAYDIVVDDLPFTTKVVAVWENSAPCNGDEYERNAWAVTPAGAVFADGGISSGAPARYFGGANTLRLTSPIVGMSATGTGDGYWLVAGDGGIFTYGDARFFGSTGNIRLNRPVVGMSTTPSGNGYWMVASDGGIFNYGDAVFRGSTGAIRLNQPIIGMVATPSGGGYWLVAADGGVFTFGDATFRGSLGGTKLSSPVRGLVPTGDGYAVFTDAEYYVF